jgi:hypothetical protein
VKEHRSLKALAAVLVLVSSGALIAACGSDDDSAASAESTTESANAVLIADFKRCPFNEGGLTAAGWAGSVAGDVSCEEAGELIQQHFLRDWSERLVSSQAESIRKSGPARYTSAGYDCATFPLPDGMGWHALCGTSDAHVSFYITP